MSPTAAVSTLILEKREKRVRFRLTNGRVCRGLFAEGCLPWAVYSSVVGIASETALEMEKWRKGSVLG